MNELKVSNDLRTLKLTVGLYILIFFAKLTVYFISGVMGLFAESLHTLSDLFIVSFLLVATKWSQKEADTAHMFGYGRAQNVAALVAATLLISFTSLELYREAVPRLSHPESGTFQNLTVVLWVLIGSMAIAAAPLVQLFTAKKREATTKALFVGLITDELGLLAALLGTLFILWGQPVGDAIAAIVVATIIAFSAIGLFRENASFLLGRSPGPAFVTKIESLALSVSGVLGLHDLRAEYVGPEIVHTGFHIVVPRGMPIEEADRIAEEVREQVHLRTGCRYCTIHVDPSG